MIVSILTPRIFGGPMLEGAAHFWALQISSSELRSQRKVYTDSKVIKETNMGIVFFYIHDLVHGRVHTGRFSPPEWVTSHIKKPPNQNVDTPSVGTLNGPHQTPSNLFGVGCPQSTDSADWGHTRHAYQFQHVISQSCFNFGPSTFSGSTKLAKSTVLAVKGTQKLKFPYVSLVSHPHRECKS